MALFTVRCLSPHGSVVSLLVDASSTPAARQHPTICSRRVLSVRRHWREWLGLRRVDLSEQRLLLTQMAMQLSRGNLPPKDLQQILVRLPGLRRNFQSRPFPNLAGLAPSELLLMLNIHPFAVTLCREGERLGQIPDRLLQAADFLDWLHKLRAQLRGPLLKASMYALTAIGLFAVTPFLFQMLVSRLSSRVEIQTTMATDILMTLHTMLTFSPPLAIGAVGLAGYAGYYFWDHIRILPLLKDIDSLVRGMRSSMLLSILAPAFRKGIHLANLMRSLQPLLGRKASEYLYARLSAGHSLSQSLSDRYFSRTLTVGLHHFETIPAAQLAKLFATIQTSLRTEIGWHLDRVVRGTRWFYTGLILTLLLLLVQGFLVPIYSLSVR